MSQVRKFYSGGKNKKTPVNIYIKDDPEAQVVSGPKSQGTFTIDGKTYSGEDLAEDLERTGGMYSPDAEKVYRAVAEAVRNGQHVVFDSKNNVISGMDGKWGISEKANSRLSNMKRSSFMNGVGSLFNTEASKVRDNLRYLGHYTYKPIKVVEPETGAKVETSNAAADGGQGKAQGPPVDPINKPYNPKEHGGFTQDQLDSISGRWDAKRKRVVIDDPEHIFDGYSNRNYRFNDLFFKAFTDPKYAWLKDKMIVDGVLYDQSDADKVNSEVYKFLRQAGGYYDRASNLNYAGANELMENLWGGESNWGFLDDHLYSNILSKQNRGYQDRSDLYNLSGYAPDSHLVRYVDVDPTKTDAFGEYKDYVYKLLDKYGSDAGDVDITKLNPNAKGTKHGAIEFRELLKSNDTESPYNNRYVTDTKKDADGNRTGTYFYVDPNDPDDLIIHMDEFNKYNVLKGGDIRLPRQIAHILLKNPNLIERLNTNPVARDNFARWLAGMFKDVDERMLSDPWHFVTNENNFALGKDDWSRLGFDDQTRLALISFYKNFVKDSKSNRQNSNLVYAPEFIPWKTPSMKNGGQIQKMATGDIVGSAGTVQAKANETKSNKPIRSSADEATTSDILKGELTEADKFDIAALVADIGSFALSLTGVGSIAAAGVGAGGSLARFASDVKRDGFQWSDAGSLGLNLLFDGVTAIPGLGTAGKVGKLTKAIKASAPTLLKWLKPLAALGTGQAAYTLVKKVASGEELSIRDWSTLANGLTAAVSLNRSGLRGPVKTKETGRYKEASFGEFNGKKMELSADEMKTLAGKKTAKERMGFAAEKLTEKANAGLAENAERATKEQLLEYLTSGKVNGVKTNFKVGHEGWRPTLTQADIEATPVMEQVLRKEYSGKNIFGRIGNLINGRGKTIGGVDRLETNYPFLNSKTKNEMVNEASSKTTEKINKSIGKTSEELTSSKNEKTKYDAFFEKLNGLIDKKRTSSKTQVTDAIENAKSKRLTKESFPNGVQGSKVDEFLEAREYINEAAKNANHVTREEIPRIQGFKEKTKAKSEEISTKINELSKNIKKLRKERIDARNVAKQELNAAFAKNHNTIYRGWTLPAFNNLPNPEKPGNRRGEKSATVASPTWRIGVAQPSFKNGGIIKASNGTRDIQPLPSVQTINPPKYLIEQSWDPILERTVNHRSNAEINPIPTVNQNITLSNYDALQKEENSIGYKQYLDNIQEQMKTYQYGSGNTSNKQGNWADKLGVIDPSNIIDAGNFAAAMADSRRQYNSLKDYHAAHAIAPTLVVPRLQLNAGDALRSTISGYRKPVSADSMQNAAIQQVADQQNAAIAQKANLQDAQQYAQYLAELNNTGNKQSQINAQITSANNESDSNVDLNRRKAYNQMVAQNSQIRNQHLNKVAYDAHNRWMAQNQARTASEVNNRLVDAQNEFDANTAKFKADYKTWSKDPNNIDATTKTPKLSFTQWMTNTGRIDAYNKEVRKLSQIKQRVEEYRNLMINYGTTFGRDYLKSGGKITKVDASSALSDFNTQARMLIESGKITSKFISDLNKLIQQAKKE